MFGRLKSAAVFVPLPVWAALAGTAAVLVFLGILAAFDMDQRVLGLLYWLQGQGSKAALIFFVIMALATVLLLPGVVFTVGAGFVFGVLPGTLLVVSGTTLGAACAFLASRHLFGEKMSGYFLSHVRMRAAGQSLVNDGLRIVLFTRLIPFFPFKVSNYFFGLTPVRFRDFVLGTLFGIVPFSLHNAYLGSMAADLVSLGASPTERTALEWVVYIIGLVLIVIAVSGLARIAQKAIKLNPHNPKEDY